MTRPLRDYSNPFARNFTETYTDEHKPDRTDLANWREETQRYLVFAADALWKRSKLGKIAAFDSKTLESYLHDALSDATEAAFRELEA